MDVTKDDFLPLILIVLLGIGYAWYNSNGKAKTESAQVTQSHLGKMVLSEGDFYNPMDFYMEKKVKKGNITSYYVKDKLVAKKIDGKDTAKVIKYKDGKRIAEYEITLEGEVISECRLMYEDGKDPKFIVKKCVTNDIEEEKQYE